MHLNFDNHFQAYVTTRDGNGNTETSFKHAYKKCIKKQNISIVIFCKHRIEKVWASSAVSLKSTNIKFT